jgi:4'-phosphopantetheinyl transferase
VKILWTTLSKGENMICIYAIRYFGCDSEKDVYSFLNILSEEKKERVNKYIFKEDKIRCILGEILLRFALWKHFGLVRNDIKFIYNEYGKPSLYGKDGIHFSISHSGSWVLCGISDSPIGVDVECIPTDSLNIAKRFFTKEEYKYIKKQPIENQREAFCKIWTLKESYIKLIGKGLSIPLDSFSFNLLEDHIQFVNNLKVDDSYLFKSDKINDSYCMACCVKKEETDISNKKVIMVTMKQLLKWKNDGGSN